MRVLLNNDNILSSPLKTPSSSLFIFEDEQGIFQSVQGILNGTPTSYLVSGYRGVGKTSLINMIIEQVASLQSSAEVNGNDEANKKRKSITARINLTKYEEHSIILRKIIRHIYLSTPERIINEIKDRDPKFLDELKLLYDRTYQEISIAHRTSKKSDILRTRTLSLNIRKVVLPRSAAIVFGMGVLSSLIGRIVKWISHYSNYWYVYLVLFIGAMVWSVVEAIQYQKVITNSQSFADDMDRKALYDDEIAEYLLEKIFDGFRDNQIEVLIIIDELDKLKDENVESIISNLKPLMLSGRATFILVTGHQFYHKYRYSKSESDSVLSSVFSKVIYVGLMSTAGLRQLFGNLVAESTVLSKTIWVDYINSKILESNRIPRQFINIIRQEIVWKDNKAYIEINDSSIKAYRSDSRILGIIQKIEKGEVLDEIAGDHGTRDFYITQLHTAVHRMKIRKYFTKEEIFEEPKSDETREMTANIFNLNQLIVMLIDTMADEMLLQKRSERIQNEEKTIFEWTNPLLSNDTSDEKNLAASGSRFLRMFDEVELEAKVLFSAFNGSQEKNSDSLTIVIKKLSERGLINGRWARDSQLMKLMDIRSKLLQGGSITDPDVEIMLDYRVKLLRFRGELLEKHTSLLLKEYLAPLGYLILETQKSEFDFIVRGDSVDILIESKTTINAHHVDTLLRIYKEHKVRTGRKTYLVVTTLDNRGWNRYLKERVLSEFKDNFLLVVLSADDAMNRRQFEELVSKITSPQNGEVGKPAWQLFLLLRNEIRRLDPADLFPLAPDDEYDSEIQMIIEKLPDATSAHHLAEIINKIFVDSFNVTPGRSEATYFELAEKVYGKFVETY